MTELHRMGVAELGRALDAKSVSSVELTRHLLERLARHEALGTVLATAPEVSLAQARAADARRAAGERGPLLGVPVAHKDIFVTRDFASTAGSRMLAGYQSPFDATVVSQLAASGMVTLAKLNCDEFAMGGSNENSAWFPARNPWDPTRIPGGSSGGSAAAVAARLVPAATGTDTGGSVRQPASLTGVTGIKPTYGRCSRYGMVAFASSLDQAGPIARSALDCAHLLQAMSGFDPRDATSAQRAVGDLVADTAAPRADATPGRPLAGLRVGVPAEFFGAGVAADVLAATRAALGELEKL
ncbi:MAG TPA: amidase, partial [Burkholderiaceae bacterium]|nr:amidase [Burkholderiaceae bacterium]